ncbi:SurA N-terminal domain-containing protein [Candidatus Pelagibacter sp.]|nr:SurA N-terminal domain-containing protein [Candidatus Pelagibacter sp.]
MLNKLRNFAKTKIAGVVIGIIIIPFVFWGMGGVFSGGNTNIIAKINNQSISTQDFMDHLNSSKITLETIKDNINNNIVEEMLGKLISKKMIQLEEQDLNLIISDKILKKRIKKNDKFLDENKKFSRTKYEKFLLSSNLTAVDFESMLRSNELKKNLFSYVVGGIKSPIFLTNNTFKEQNKKISINYINLENVYKKQDDFTTDKILKYINKNKENLKEKNISFNYSKITPKTLIGIDEYNDLFFRKIDNIENDISNGITFDELLNSYNLKSIFEENFKSNNNNNSKVIKNEMFVKIFKNAKKNKIELLDQNDFYLLYEITKVEEILPSFENTSFINKVREIMFNKSKNDFNYDLIKKISEKNFNQKNFDEISLSSYLGIENVEISSITDIKKFTTDSVKHLYSLPKNSFGLIGDKNQNIYLIKVLKISENNISASSENYKKYNDLTNVKIRDSMYESYDFHLNNKYKVKINEKTFERVKNYFK